VARIAEILFHTDPQSQAGTSSAGGANVYTREIATAAARAGHDVHSFTRRDNPFAADDVFVEPGYTVHYITAGPMRPLDRFEQLAYVEEFTHGVARVFDRIGDPDVVHANYWLSAMAGHQLKHERDIPLVVTFHTLELVKADHFEAESDQRAIEEKVIFSCADAVLASCDVEAQQFIQFYDADPARIHVVPLGVERAFFSPGNRVAARQALGLDAHNTLLLYVGRLQPLKGVDLALETVIAMRERGEDATLAIIGGPSGPDGPATLAALHQRARETGVVDRVRFVAPQSHVTLSTWMRAATVTLVPSRSESFGLVALESSSCGTPVVASAVGGLLNVIRPGVNGTLVPTRSPADWADAVDELMAADFEGAIGLSAAELARGYTWHAAAAALVVLVEQIRSKKLIHC
jgi:D-inositol-3-phosphate glycosyltransferase